MAKSTRRRQFYSFCAVVSVRARLRDGRHENVNSALSSNNKDQLIDSNKYLNQKVTTAMDTLDGSTSQQNYQDYLAAISNKVGSIKSLV